MPPPAEEDEEEEEDDDDDDMEDDGDGGFNRIPLSNEIVLRGHTKVNTSDVLLPSFIIGSLKFC
jgi:hypothetical protein